ncbi:MAG: YdcF family protein [Firmicutes bacterium]|nr:YdcF family protein [Bacillota bacterium]
MHWIAILICVAAITGSFWLWGSVSAYRNRETPSIQREGAIILGASLSGNRASPALIERMEHGLSLYRKGITPLLILSGGSPRGKQVSEAEVMQDYLQARGVPKSALLLEPHSSNTAENLSHTRDIVKARGIGTVYLVTHDYHMFRALRCARDVGLSVVPAPVHSRTLWMPYHKCRECLALIKYLLMTKAR